MGYVGNQTSNNYSSMDKQVITGDGTPNYTLTHAVANAQEIEVFVNNVRQEAGIAYTVAGTALNMTGNVASTDDFYVIYQGKALQTVVPPDGSVSTAKLANGSVTQAKLASSVTLIPTGMIAPFAMSTAPTGWLECDGSAVSRTTYADLFTALSTTHGVGDGSTTFNVPDLRGEFIRGWDNSKGTDSGRTFASSQADNANSISQFNSSGSGQITNSLYTVTVPTDGTYSDYLITDGRLTTYGSGAIRFQTNGIETRPRNIAMMYCVKA
jgi:microcystin-dependent protein